MAYQPKFAKNHRQPEKASPVGAAVTLGIVLVSLLISGMLLRYMFFHLAGPKTGVQTPAKDLTISQSLQDHIAQDLAAAQQVLSVSQTQEEAPPAPTEATVPPYEVKYTLDAETMVAPEPDQSRFGQVSDPADMAPILKEAEYILDGQSLYFSTEAELFPGSIITYYLDETIFAITWKEPHGSTVYTFSEVKVGHASQFRRHLSDGAYGSGKLYLPTEMAATVNAVVATSGDFYANRPALGIMVHEGTIYRTVEDSFTETCYIDSNGDMIFSHMKELQNTQNAQAFIEENDINFSLAFGPILVENYEVRELPNVYSVGEIKEEYARSALCQMDELHYLVAVANWEGNYPDDPTVAQFQKVIAATGCKMAYCLDGGQTATVITNDKLINRPAKGEQRRISDILYFATAVPEEG